MPAALPHLRAVSLLALALWTSGARAAELGSAVASGEDEATGRAARGGPPNVAGAPFVRFTPETAWGFGAVGLAWFHADEAARTAGRGSSVGLALQYTTRRQTCTAAQADLFLKAGTLHAYGVLLGEQWPYELWGVGAAATRESEAYTPRTLRYEAALTRLAIDRGGGQGLWLGLRSTGREDRIVEDAPGGLVDRCAVAGCEGGRVVTLQVQAAWDTRDHVFAAHRGLFVQARAGGAAAALGSGSRFAEVEVDARAYAPLAWARGSTLAFQARLHATGGDVPFYLLPTFGGDKSLRGVLDGRHRDKTSLLVQGEWDVPLPWRLGLELFGGAGQVAPRPGALGLGRFVPAGGAGLRLVLDPANRVFVRVEHGVAAGSRQWYLSIGQAI
ncbi:MAG TPA: BamA/TamA family outer membrane protein [Anaeromyxobacteraceae bacterium]|nr:BamA/TamA family outer membrane protein [Anaeromyxobacteraceae bacterium]